MIVTDYLLLKAIQRRIGANAIRVRFATEFFFRTRIYRIDTDASLGEVLSSRLNKVIGNRE